VMSHNTLRMSSLLPRVAKPATCSGLPPGRWGCKTVEAERVCQSSLLSCTGCVSAEPYHWLVCR
jgi:hypothetical protein